MQGLQSMRGSDGAAAVEFALVLPFLLILFLGITLFGVTFLEDLALSNAVRQGARLGVQKGVDAPVTCSDVRDRVYASDGSLDLDGSANPPARAHTLVIRSLPSELEVCGSDAERPCLTAEANGDDRLQVELVEVAVNVPIGLVPSLELTRSAVFTCEYSS